MRNMIRNFVRDERGVALPTAMIVLAALTLMAVGVIVISGGNGRAAERSNADSKAFSLAEAGSAEALAILRDADDPLSAGTITASGPRNREGGTSSYTATLDDSTTPARWIITSTGTVDNPTGPDADDVTRTVTTTAEVVPSTRAEAVKWDRFYHDHETRCLVIDTITLRGSITSRGDICLRNGGDIARRDDPNIVTWVRVGDDLFTGPSAFVGSGSAPLDRFDVGDRCRKGNSPSHRPCSTRDNVWADESGTSPGTIVKPEVDFDHWYANAKPGPSNNCTVGRFPNGFDNNGFRDNSHNAYGEVTPTNSSYTCQYWERGEMVGELSWNHRTHILRIHGTIYIDGDVRFDDNGQIVNYQGRGVIYASGDLEFDELVCAGGNGSNDCYDDTDDWDPEENQLVLLSGGWSEYDQGSNLAPTAFQGLIYATEHCLIRQGFHVSGPVICDDIRIQENDEDEGGGWPTFFDWPPLESLVDGLIGGSSEPADYDIVVKEEIS